MINVLLGAGLGALYLTVSFARDGNTSASEFAMKAATMWLLVGFLGEKVRRLYERDHWFQSKDGGRE